MVDTGILPLLLPEGGMQYTLLDGTKEEADQEAVVVAGVVVEVEAEAEAGRIVIAVVGAGAAVEAEAVEGAAEVINRIQVFFVVYLLHRGSSIILKTPGGFGALDPRWILINVYLLFSTRMPSIAPSYMPSVTRSQERDDAPTLPIVFRHSCMPVWQR